MLTASIRKGRERALQSDRRRAPACQAAVQLPYAPYFPASNSRQGSLCYCSESSSRQGCGRVDVCRDANKHVADYLRLVFWNESCICGSGMPASTHPLCFLSFRPCAVSLAVRKDAARRRDICRESTSSNASKLAAAGRCFPSPAMPKATTTGTPSPTAATMSSGTWAALAVV